jgi:hypothetical protein
MIWRPVTNGKTDKVQPAGLRVIALQMLDFRRNILVAPGKAWTRRMDGQNATGNLVMEPSGLKPARQSWPAAGSESCVAMG